MPKIPMRSVEVVDHIRAGEIAKAQRQKAGKLVHDVAKRMKVTPAYVYDLERGRSRWTVPLWEQYGKALK